MKELQMKEEDSREREKKVEGRCKEKESEERTVNI